MRGARKWWTVGLAAASIVLAIGVGGCANGSSEDSDASPGGGGDGSGSDGPNGGDSGCGNIQTSVENCGSCNHPCAQGEMCSNGSCGIGCAAPETQCGGDGGAPFFDAGEGDAGEGGAGPVDAGSGGEPSPYCANLTNDTANCGACGKTCGANHTCMAGACVLDCPANTTACPSADFCIPPMTCCTNADCADAGGNCTGPGGTCGCSTPDTLGGSCAAATSPAALTVGGSVSESGALSMAGEENWVHVTFSGNTNLAYHPHVKLSTNPNGEFIFDLVSNCTGTPLACFEGGSCTGKTEWEVKYTATITALDVGSGMFQPIPPVGAAGQVWIRVYRVAGGQPSCDAFTLTISN